MKKISLIFAFMCVTFVCGLPPMDPAEKMEKMMKIAGKCQASSGATPDDIKFIMSKKEPESKEGKCMFNCIMEMITMVKDGKINKDPFMLWMSMQKGSNDKIAEEVYNECNAISDPDPCENGVKLGACFRTTAAKHGIDCTF